MKYSEVERRVSAKGCYFYKNGGDGHPVWFSPITGMYFKLSHHRNKEVRTGTLNSISKSSGVKL